MLYANKKKQQPSTERADHIHKAEVHAYRKNGEKWELRSSKAKTKMWRPVVRLRWLQSSHLFHWVARMASGTISSGSGTELEM
jgi:hypothetical protein